MALRTNTLYINNSLSSYVIKTILVVWLFFLSTSSFSQNTCIDYSAISKYRDKEGVEYGIARVDKTWDTGKVITVGFFNGDSKLRRLVLSHASEWSNYGNITFQLSDVYNADIRIEFNTSGINYSYVGTDAESQNRNSHTMTLSYTGREKKYDFKSTVLHEFGHALGLLHEHQHSEFPFTWNDDKVVAFYLDRFGWPRKKTFDNVIKRYGKGSGFTNERYDKYSIMHYRIPAEFTMENIAIGENYVLSEGDKRIIAKLYPGRNVEPVPNDLEKKDNITYREFNYLFLKVHNLNFKNNIRFLDLYVQKYRLGAGRFPRDEFEKVRLRNEVLSELSNGVQAVDFSKTYHVGATARLGRYSFQKSSFPLKWDGVLYNLGYHSVFEVFPSIRNRSSAAPVFINLKAINVRDFSSVSIDEQYAEDFLNEFTNRNVYIVAEYIVLQRRRNFMEIVNLGQSGVKRVYGYVEKLYLYSDSNQQNPIMTLKSVSSKDSYNSTQRRNNNQKKTSKEDQ